MPLCPQQFPLASGQVTRCANYPRGGCHLNWINSRIFSPDCRRKAIDDECGRMERYRVTATIRPRIESLNSGTSGNEGTVPDRGTRAPPDSASRSPCRGVPGHLGWTPRQLSMVELGSRSMSSWTQWARPPSNRELFPTPQDLLMNISSLQRSKGSMFACVALRRKKANL